MQGNASVSDSTKLGALTHLLEVAMKVGRYLPVIVVSFAGLNLFLAVNDFLVSNTGFGILNSIFALGGFIFLVQLHQKRKIHSHDYYYNYKKGSSEKIVAEAGHESENVW
jgi:hypothetical protein